MPLGLNKLRPPAVFKFIKLERVVKPPLERVIDAEVDHQCVGVVVECTLVTQRAREREGDNGVVITYPETSDGPLAPRCRQESSRFSRHPGEGDKNGDAADVHTIDLAQRRRWRSGSSFMVLVSEGRKEGRIEIGAPADRRPTDKQGSARRVMGENLQKNTDIRRPTTRRTWDIAVE